jgi:hypothetical protein
MGRLGIGVVGALAAISCGGTSGAPAVSPAPASDVAAPDVEAPPVTSPGEVLEATKLAGPWTSLEEYCAEYLLNAGADSAAAEGLPPPICDPDTRCDLVPMTPLYMPGDIEQISFLKVAEFAQGFCNVAIKTRRGWFVRPKSVDTYLESAVHPIEGGVQSWSAHDAEDGRHAVAQIDYWEGGDNIGDGRTETWSLHQLFLCGIGSDAIPSCLNVPHQWGLEVYEHSETGEDVQTVDQSVDFSMTFEAGVLTVTGDVDVLPSDLRDEMAPVLGTHTLVFPN